MAPIPGRIFVANFDGSMTSEELRELFEHHLGHPVQDAFVKLDGPHSRRFGYVQFWYPSDVDPFIGPSSVPVFRKNRQLDIKPAYGKGKVPGEMSRPTRQENIQQENVESETGEFDSDSDVSEESDIPLGASAEFFSRGSRQSRSTSESSLRSQPQPLSVTAPESSGSSLIRAHRRLIQQLRPSAAELRRSNAPDADNVSCTATDSNNSNDLDDGTLSEVVQKIVDLDPTVEMNEGCMCHGDISDSNWLTAAESARRQHEQEDEDENKIGAARVGYDDWEAYQLKTLEKGLKETHIVKCLF